MLCYPGIQTDTKSAAGNDRLAPKMAGLGRQHRPYSINLQTMETIDDASDDLLVIPPHQEEGCRSIPKVMLARTFPDEVPGMRRVHPKDSPPITIDCPKASGLGFGKASLVVGNSIRVVTR